MGWDGAIKPLHNRRAHMSEAMKVVQELLTRYKEEQKSEAVRLIEEIIADLRRRFPAPDRS